MEKGWQDRVEQLEQEVTQLKKELALLQKNAAQSTMSLEIKQEKVNRKVPVKKVIDVEEGRPKTKALQWSEELAEKPSTSKTFEERIITILPKIFMIILVLGILWGLKLASDYGFLSDSIKIIFAYIVSVVLGFYAWHLEKKRARMTSMVVSLAGGSFIIGILATAAATILYDIFPLMLALIIALLYITYGIGICYFKQSQTLTSFVVFTSLLLPYLLEYMDFDKLLIVLYIILLFLAIQLVILKYQQQLALYIAMFFSLLAIQLIWLTQYHSATYFAWGYLIVLTVFVNSWWRLFCQSVRRKKFQTAALFSTSSFTIILLNTIIYNTAYQFYYLVIVLILFTSLAWIAHKQQERHVLDVMATIALLVTLNLVLTFDFAQGYDQLALVFAAITGMLLGIRLRAPIMQVTYAVILFLLAFVLNFTTNVRPFWDVGNVSNLLLMGGLITAYIYAKMPKLEMTRFEKGLVKYYLLDIISASIVLYTLLYVVKIDHAYFSTAGHMAYIAFCLTALSMLAVLTFNKHWLGIFVPLLLIICYLAQSMTLLTTGFIDTTHYILQVITRSVFFLILLALLIDIYKKGRIYQNWQHLIERQIEIYMLALSLFSLVHASNLVTYLYNNSTWIWGISVMLKTLLLFVTACIFILIGKKREWKKVSIAGFILLLLAIFKLIFIDLASLNLLIRTILFIVVGVTGMLLSGKLGKK